MMASSTPNTIHTPSPPPAQQHSVDHRASKHALNPDPTFNATKQTRPNQRSSPAHGNNITQHTKRNGRPVVPSFTQEPALGSSTSTGRTTSPRPTYSSAASASIVSASGATEPHEQRRTSRHTHSGTLNLDLLPQRTQSAPPELHEEIPSSASTFTQVKVETKDNAEKKTEILPEILPAFVPMPSSMVDPSIESAQRPSHDGRDFIPNYYKPPAASYTSSSTLLYPTMPYPNSPYTLTGYTPHGIALYSMNYMPSPIASVSSPLVTSFAPPSSSSSSSSATLFVKPPTSRKTISIKHPDTKEEIVISKPTVLPDKVTPNAVEVQSEIDPKKDDVEPVCQLETTPCCEMILPTIVLSKVEPLEKEELAEKNTLEELLEGMSIEEPAAKVSQAEAVPLGEEKIENLSSRIYDKKMLYALLQSQKFECPSMEDTFRTFLDLLERASSYSLQGASRGGEKRHHHSGASGQKMGAPPGYEASGPPGFSRRQDGGASRSSRGDSSPSHGAIQRGRVSSTPLIARRAASPQPVLLPTEGRWVRPTLVKDESTKTDIVLRLVNGSLNKLTPDNFERLSMTVIQTLVGPLGVLVSAYPKLSKAVMANEEPVWSEDEDEARSLLAQVIGAFFDKAVDEPHFAPLYAGLCRVIADNPQLPEYPARKSTTDSTLAPVSMFRMALLHRCRAEYEKKIAWSNNSASSTSLSGSISCDTTATTDKSSACVSSGTEVLDEAEIEFTRLKTKRRVLGNIAFIGHLYKHGLLREEIILSLVQETLNASSSDEDDLECCIQMLNSTGSKLEASSAARLDVFFTKLHTLTTSESKLSNRIKFAIMDLIDLRKAAWHKDLISKVSQQQQQHTGRGPIGIASAPALLRSTSSSLGTPGRRRGDFTEVRSIATRLPTGKPSVNSSSVSTSAGFSSNKLSTTSASKNKFGLLNDIGVASDDSGNQNSLGSLSEKSDDEMDVDVNEHLTQERTVLISILKSAMNEDPSQNDLTQMAQRARALMEAEPSLAALLLSETFDASETKQLKLCSFCQLMTTTAPIPDTLFEVLSETIRLNFESWVEDMPLLGVNLGRLLANLLGGHHETFNGGTAFVPLKISPEIGHSYAIALAGSLLRHLKIPLSLEQVKACTESLGVAPGDLDLFCETHKIPRI
ncbi:hypothetical protein MDAP_001284 [Mitosporidium daphniae]